jgi:hypothetical protein
MGSINHAEINTIICLEKFISGMLYNGSAMVSTGIKSSELLIKHLAKTFYFVLSFLF